MSLHRKMDVKIFLMFIVAESTRSVNILHCTHDSLAHKNPSAMPRGKEGTTVLGAGH